MGRPGTTPKPATPPSPSRGRPGGVKTPYLLDDHASDLLLIDPVVEAVDTKLVESAVDFEAIVDSHYPPEGKVIDPLEAAVDKDISAVGDVTLIMLDTADDIYFNLITKQSALPPKRDGTKSDQYWTLNKKIDLQKQLLVSLGRRWRWQEDKLNREIMSKHTEALRK